MVSKKLHRKKRKEKRNFVAIISFKLYYLHSNLKQEHEVTVPFYKGTSGTEKLGDLIKLKYMVKLGKSPVS